MIAVTIDLYPSVEGEPKRLGWLKIENTETGSETVGRYQVHFCAPTPPCHTRHEFFQIECERGKPDSVWLLVQRALEVVTKRADEAKRVGVDE